MSSHCFMLNVLLLKKSLLQHVCYVFQMFLYILNAKILLMFNVKNKAMKRQSCVMKDVYQ